MSSESTSKNMISGNERRYSLSEIIDEVRIERRDSQFGRQLVDAAEIDKMFQKNRRKKKKVK